MKHPFQKPLFLVLIFRPSEETEDFDTPQGDFVDFEDSTDDALNRLTTIIQTPTPEGILENIFGADAVNILNAQYVGKDRPQSYTFGNNVQTTFVYDDLKRLTSLNVERSTQNVERLSYGYDKTGNRLFEERQTAEVERKTFDYDSVYRLTRFAGPTVTHQWSLDKVDNWLERQVVIARPEAEAISRVTQFNPNEVNAYTTVDSTPYIYDENGNLIDDGTNLYYYNYRNLLTRVVDKATSDEVASYGYDALGRRIFKTVDGQMTRFIYEGIHLIAEIAPDNTISKEFIYGDSIDDPIAVIARSGSDEAIYYYHKDGLGSTTALTDSEGNIAETYQYGPYGEVEIHDASGTLLEDSAAGNPFLYTGQFFDSETNFYYYKARYYHPTLGRFLQRDPLGYVDGYNLYAYTANNPINWVDPLGRWAWWVHNKIIDEAFPDLSEEVREAIKRGSRNVDKDQSIEGAFKHAMRAPGQPVEDTREKMETFITEKMGLYKQKLETGQTIEAYELLGEAIHPVMDFTSPVHKGFQVWEGLSHWIKAGQHASQELSISEEQLETTVKEVQSEYSSFGKDENLPISGFRIEKIYLQNKKSK